MIRRKSEEQPKPNTIHYNVSEEPVIFPKATTDILLKTKYPGQCIALYHMYYYTAKWQRTNQPKATASYIGKSLNWSDRYVRKIKSILISVGLIENIRIIDNKTKKVKGWYIKLNFIWAEKTTRNFSHPVALVHTNALSTNNKNALSTNKPLKPPKSYNGSTPSIKIFKKYLPKEFLKNKKLLPTIKDFIESRVDLKKPLTDRAIKMICNKCVEFTPKEVQSAFEIAVINENLSIFPRKENNYNQKYTTKKDLHAPSAVKAGDKKYREYDEIRE